MRVRVWRYHGPGQQEPAQQESGESPEEGGQPHGVKKGRRLYEMSISLPLEGVGRAGGPWRVRSWGEASKGPAIGKVGSMQRGEGRCHSETLCWHWHKAGSHGTLGPGSLGAHHDGISEGHNVDRPHGAEAGQDGKDDIVPRFLGAFTPFHPRPCQLGAGMTA